jgi:predicted HicB family RNase H-like nuclease
MNRQTAFWNHYTIHNTHRPAHDDRPKRSEKRQRTKRITLRLLPAERAALELAADQAHMSLAEYVRSSALHRTTSDITTAATREADQSE